MKHDQTTRNAKEFLDRHWDGRLPIDPAAMAEKAGILVVDDACLSGEGLSGCFDPEAGRPVIRYNPKEAEVRQRFTVAHEIGHFVLGHGAAYRDPAANFATNAAPTEAAANRFAAALLMPSEVVEAVIKEQANPTLESLAALFGVSTVAMRYRLINLGWLRG